MQLILSHKVSGIDKGSSLFVRHGAGLGEDGELTGCNAIRRQSAGVKLGLTDAHDVPRAIERYLDVRRAGVILDAAICVVAENSHVLGGEVHVRETGGILVVIFAAGVRELLIHCENREEGHHDRGAVAGGLVNRIGLQNLGGLVIDAGHQ